MRNAYILIRGSRLSLHLLRSCIVLASLQCCSITDAQISIPAVNTPVFENFNILATSGSSNVVMPPGWSFLETGGAANGMYSGGNGSSAIADTWSFGFSATDRALGEITSSIFNSKFGASFTNNTGATINSLLINYTGEQWRLGTDGIPDRLDFQYSLNATSVGNAGTWVDVNQLDFFAPTENGPVGLLDGNLSTNRTLKGYLITGLSIANGSTFWIRWNSTDNITGNDHGMSIDDFSISANPTTQYNVDITGSDYTITDIAGNSDNLAVVQSNTNILFNVPGRLYSVNNAGQFYFPHTVLTTDYTSFTINAAGGNDKIVLSDNNITYLPYVTVNGGPGDDLISIEGSVVISSGYFLDLNLQNDAATPGIDSMVFTNGSNIVLDNTASCEIKLSRNLMMNAGSALQGNAGSITIECNQQATPTSGNFIGLRSTGGLIGVNGAGVLDIKAKGGNASAGSQHGISLLSNADILGGTTTTAVIEGRAGASTGPDNCGIRMTATGTSISSNGCSLMISGYGNGINTSNNLGVVVLTGSSISPGGTGEAHISGYGAATTGVSNAGVYVQGTNARITSTNGNVFVTGYGGGSGASSSTCDGVVVTAAGSIRAGSSNGVYVQGTGGINGGNNNCGVRVANGTITSTSGFVNVIGFGGGNGAGTGHTGVYIETSGTITSGGGGAVTVEGEGGNGTGQTHGVQINLGTISSSGGNVSVFGLEGNGASSYGFIQAASTNVTTNTSGGNITIHANSISTSGNIITQAIDTLNIVPYDAGIEIELNATADASGGPLRLAESELDQMVTGTLVIGNSTAGKITLDQVVTRIASTHINLISSRNIVFNSGSANLSGGNLRLEPGNTPYAVQPNADAPEMICNTATVAGRLNIIINGTTPATQYEQLSVNGAVNLSLTTLVISGSHVPQPGDVFTIVENDGADPVVGTFIGLAQGGTINSFMGSVYPATISYTGGTGNDVVITVGNPNYIITNNGDVVTITDVSGISNSLWIQQSGSNVQFWDFPKTFSLNGTAVTDMPYSFDPASIDTIRVKLEGGSDWMQLHSFGFNLPTLDINGGAGNDDIELVGNVTFQPNASLLINLQDDGATPGLDNIEAINGHLAVSGAGMIDMQVSNYVYMSNSSLTAVNGDIIVKANDQVPANTGSFPGLYIFGNTSFIKSNGSGDIDIRGTGGTSHGVHIDLGADIIGGTTGTTTLYGKGASNATMSNGIHVNGNGTTITSQGGHVTLTGIGGSGTGGYKDGILVYTGASVSAGGAGNLEINGTGGSSNNGACIGVHVLDNSTITSNGGHLTVLGTGGVSAGTFNCGVYVAVNSEIQTTGNGNLIIEGSGGLATGNNNHGVYLFSSDAFTTAQGNMTIIGTGGGAGASSGNMGIVLESGGTVLAGGYIQMEGNASLGGSANTSGILINTIVETINGDITLSGAGATAGTASLNRGVYINSGTGAGLEAGGTGDIHITGLGGNTATSDNWGITISGNNTSVITNDGNITLIGFGGLNMGSSQNSGTVINLGADLFAGGSGGIFIEGTAGTNTGNFNYGVSIANTGTTITTNAGSITIEGQGGGSGATSHTNRGIWVLSGALIKSGGTGAVTVTGTGGNGAGSFNYGIDIMLSNAAISSSGGPVSVSGFGGGSGASTTNYGVYINSTGSITAEGNGQVTVHGVGGSTTGGSNSGVYITNPSSMITSAGGNVTVTGIGGNGTSANHGVYIGIDGLITASGSGQVTVNGTGGNATSGNSNGVYVSGANARILSAGGDLIIIGNGGTTGTNSHGVAVTNSGLIKSVGNSDLHITGHQGATGGFISSGIYLTNSAARAESGNIFMTGFGDGNFLNQNYGIWVYTNGLVASDAGSVYMEGHGGTTDDVWNIGISVFGGDITGDTIMLEGTGGGTSGSPGDNYGIEVVHGGEINALSYVEINGYGSIHGDVRNYGVLCGVDGDITVVNGDIVITGVGGNDAGPGEDNAGIYMYNTIYMASDAGDIILQGTGGFGASGDNSGIIIDPNVYIYAFNGEISATGIEGEGPMSFGFETLSGFMGAAGLAEIAVAANTMSIAGSIGTGSVGQVTLQPLTPGRNIHLANESDVVGPGEPLRLTDAELDYVSTANLIIGDAEVNDIIVKQAMTRNFVTNILLHSGGDIFFDPGNIHTNNGNLQLQPGPSPGAVHPLTDDIDATINVMSFDGALEIIASVEKMKIVGGINLNNAALQLQPDITLMEGDSFYIVDNDDVDPVIGNFTGLPEGAAIDNIFGLGLDGIITYAGGDGNDVVMRIINPCTLPDIPVLTATQDTICENTNITLSIQSGSLGSATQWHWYANACGTIHIGTGTSIMVAPTANTTYFARGEGGCVTAAQCGQITIVVNPTPDAAIDREAPGPCYYVENIFQPQAPPIPGATYQWNFGEGAEPLTATGYGPHAVIYTTSGAKTAKLVIHPNAPGAQCPDSSLLMFTINTCPGQILGKVITITGEPMNNVNVRLFPDVNLDGIPDAVPPVRNVFTPANGQFAMASLTPGHYVIVEVQPNNWLSFDDGDTTPDNDVVANVDSLDNFIPVTLIPNEIDSMNVFIERPVAGAITGIVFEDFDADQIPDPGEGLVDVVVSLYADANTNGVADNGVPVDTAHTNQAGQYVFSEVAVGHYVLVETNPSGMNSIRDFDPSPDGDAVPNTNLNNDTLPVSIIPAELDADNFFIDVEAGCPLLVTNANDAGPGSLRFMLGCAEAGDTIQFHTGTAGDTIEISSAPLVIDIDLVIKSTLNPTVTIRSSINDLIHVTPGVDLALRDVHIVSGLSPGAAGAAIDNHGALFLHNVIIRRNPLLPPTAYLVRNYVSSHLEVTGNCTIE